MVSIRTAQSFVPTNFTLPNQLMTQAGSFADELKKWQGIYDNYAQQEYKQQMIDRLKAENERRQQQDAIGEMYKQQLVDAVNNYGGDLNSPELAKRLMSIAADNGDPKTYYGIYNKFQKRQNKGQGTGTPTKKYASDRDAEIIRTAVEQSNGDPTETENILRNNGYPGLAKKYRDSFGKPNNKNKTGDDFKHRAANELNGNSPTKANQGNTAKAEYMSEEDFRRKGIPIPPEGKHAHNEETNTDYFLIR